MNTQLEKLLLSAPFDEKDKYEIRQIFNFVSEEKKQNILKNFDLMVINILNIKKDLREKQEILLWRAISNIENAIKKARTSWIKNATTGSINKLRQIM